MVPLPEKIKLDLTPSYMKLFNAGEFEERSRLATAELSHCQLCGWNCAIDRAVDVGPCRTGVNAIVASAYVHWGEERPLVGDCGSGAIFFSNCDLRCQFCHTYRWNIRGQGQTVTTKQLAEIMLSLQEKGAGNINLVTPTHVLPQILDALLKAISAGLRLPLVWNSGGYDSVEALRLLDGIVDIYLPDMKYSDARLGYSLSGVQQYPAVNRRAVIEMHRQVGDLRIESNGLAMRGLLVRHLVMPGHTQNTVGVLNWIAQNLGLQTYLSLMDQYRPAYRAAARAELSKPITREEYGKAHKMAKDLGFARLDQSLVNQPT